MKQNDQNNEAEYLPLSYIEISRSALLNNIRQFKRILPIGNNLIAVVKANAYGHGLKEVVEIAESEVYGFQVDDIEELRGVRQVTKKPIFVFGYVPLRFLSELVELDGTLGVYNISTIERLQEIGKEKNKKITIHLKVDAYLGRQGVFVDDIKHVLTLLKTSPFVVLESLYSHFSNIEDVDDLKHAKKQYEYLLKIKEILKDEGFNDVCHHISATSGFLSDMKENWGGCMLRLGIGVYGLWPSNIIKKKFEEQIKLVPILRWVSHVVQVKEVPANFPIGYGLTFITPKPMKVAIVPQGYSDGYDRGFSNNSFVLVKGVKCNVLGRIAMNMFAVDVSNVPVSVEDELILLGKQGDEEITAEELASHLTINYEIVARISALLPRIIVE